MAYKTILTLMAMLTAITCVHGMTPQLTLPQWHDTKISITQWDKDKNELTIEASVSALDLFIKNLSCEFSASHNKVRISNPQQSKDRLEPNSTFIFKTTIRPILDEPIWLDVALRGKPDKITLGKKVKDKYKDQPNLGFIMQEEVKQITETLYFGRLVPVLAREDVALSGVKETTMLPTSYENKEYYLWHPEPTIGRGFEAESLKAFSAATRNKNQVNAEKIGNLLIGRLETNNRPLLIEKSNGDSFAIPINVAKTLINSNIATLKSIRESNVEPLVEFIKTAEKSDVKLMANFNLAQLFIEKNQPQKAKTILKRVIKKLPSWPLAQKVLAEIENSK